MTNKELVERLRSVAGFDHLPRTDLAVLAASALEASDARVKELEAERDAATAAIERVTAERDSAMARIAKAWELHEPFTWSFGYGPVQSCKWCADHGVSQEVASWPCPTIQALDGAPEPEWEYAHREGGKVYDEPSTPLAAAKILNSQPVRRRKAGPWMPVNSEGEEA